MPLCGSNVIEIHPVIIQFRQFLRCHHALNVKIYLIWEEHISNRPTRQFAVHFLVLGHHEQ